MYIGTGAAGGTVSAIDKTNADYDTLTLAATLGVAVAKGDVLFEASAANGASQKYVANFLKYAHAVKVEPGATITGVYQAYEIQESELYVPVTAKDKESLTSRFMFI
jgi:hypothetical protein